MISHHHRTVFVHVPKCGGQSIEAIFLGDLGLPWELRAPLLMRPNNDPRLGPPRLAHLLARDYTRHHYLSEELFRTYYSFAILRDPVSRTISQFNYMKSTDFPQASFDFHTFLNHWLPKQFEYRNADPVQQNSGSHSYYFVRPQVDYVTDEQGKVLVQDLFLLERIKEDFPLIRQRAGLRGNLEHRHKSVSHVRRDELSTAQERLIRELYAADYAFLASLGS